MADAPQTPAQRPVEDVPFVTVQIGRSTWQGRASDMPAWLIGMLKSKEDGE